MRDSDIDDAEEKAKAEAEAHLTRMFQDARAMKALTDHKQITGPTMPHLGRLVKARNREPGDGPRAVARELTKIEMEREQAERGRTATLYNDTLVMVDKDLLRASRSTEMHVLSNETSEGQQRKEEEQAQLDEKWEDDQYVEIQSATDEILIDALSDDEVGEMLERIDEDEVMGEEKSTAASAGQSAPHAAPLHVQTGGEVASGPPRFDSDGCHEASACEELPQVVQQAAAAGEGEASAIKKTFPVRAALCRRDFL